MESFRKFQKVSEGFGKFQKVSESFGKFRKVSCSLVLWDVLLAKVNEQFGVALSSKLASQPTHSNKVIIHPDISQMNRTVCKVLFEPGPASGKKGDKVCYNKSPFSASPMFIMASFTTVTQHFALVSPLVYKTVKLREATLFHSSKNSCVLLHTFTHLYTPLHTFTPWSFDIFIQPGTHTDLDTSSIIIWVEGIISKRISFLALTV